MHGSKLDKNIGEKVFFQGECHENNNDSGWDDLKQKRIPFGIEYSQDAIQPGESIITGKEVHLIKLLPEYANNLTNFKHFLSQIRFEIDYESLSKEKQKPATWDGSEHNL